MTRGPDEKPVDTPERDEDDEPEDGDPVEEG
jgi:hypothetical protein